jgi:2-C-methyl-D-erythritol 2,4-cyclodiphosphate synthase
MRHRIGFGYDIHRLEQGIPLWLGGVLVSAEMGAVGHSDADVLIHAVCDGLLGAAGLRDIGVHFPDTDAGYKDIPSSILLAKVIKLVGEKGYKVEQVDSTVCLEFPKISSRIPEIRTILAQLMQIAPGDVSVKATTKEGLGAIGRGEGIEAYAVVLLTAE